MLIVERWLLGRLRRRTFISLADVDAALGELMTQLNEKQILRRLGVTRRQLLEEIDRPALKDLPGEPYEHSEWRVRRVGVDYHVDIDAHYYSVPYRFARAEVEARLTARGVEIFHKGERIAVHLRGSGNRKHTTVPEHMPSSHRRYAGWTIERIRDDARKIGPATAALCEQILEARPHPEQGYRACLYIVRLAGSFGAARVELDTNIVERGIRPMVLNRENALFARNAGWTAPDGICCAKLRVLCPSEETVRHDTLASLGSISRRACFRFTARTPKGASLCRSGSAERGW